MANSKSISERDEDFDIRFLHCPFHGKVEAKKSGDSYICSGDNCQVKRTEKELE